MESVFPTATADPLGDGKFQLNPSAVAVYAFSKQTFAALVAKQMFTIGGGSGRHDITRGQYRLIKDRIAPLHGVLLLPEPRGWEDGAPLRGFQEAAADGTQQAQCGGTSCFFSRSRSKGLGNLLPGVMA